MDSKHDSETKKLSNWLLHGLSSIDIYNAPPHDLFSDSVFVIGKDSVQVYTNAQGFKVFSQLATLISNMNVYTITKADDDDGEKAEVLKVTKFYEMIHDKACIGMAVRTINKEDYTVENEREIVEQWPLIQAYGLDLVGNGFFTMKHKFQCIRDEVNKMYSEFDSFSMFRIVYDEIERFNKHYYDNFFNFNRDTAAKRL